MKHNYIAVIALLFSPLALLYAKDVPKPNIIFILADDQGYQDLGCQGAVGIQTPRIDKMAQEGLRLTSFYVSASCSPTRASLMTGRYPQRYRISGPINNPDHGLPPSETTIAELLKSKDYTTALIGKWHLGLSQKMSPIAQGFDYFSGLPLSQIERVKSNHDKYYKRQWRIMDTQGRDEVEYNPCEEQFTQRCTTEALAFIERHKNQPFFLYLAQPMVHTEVVASADFVGKSQKGIYGDACQELDWSVGQVMDRLKKLGIDEKTIVVYASDNGATLRKNTAQVPQTHLGSNLPLRGYKFESWEGGSRVPCIIRWPGQIPAGRVSDEIVSIIDFFPTFAALSGAKLPGDRPVDGVDLWPFLHGDVTHSGRLLHIYCGSGKSPAIRVGPWKIIKNEGSAQLFNLQKDLSEKEDVAGRNPDIVRQLSDYQSQVNAALKADKPLPQPPVTGERSE